MPILTNIIQAQISSHTTRIEGKILTRPELLYGDATQLTYAADVDIGQTGRDPNTGEEAVLPLKNIPIAPGNRDLIYADVGAAITLERSASGRYEIIGFAKRAPGTYTRVCVDLATGALGPQESIGLSSRPLTYEELSTLGAGYGTTPYGAIGLFRGATLLEIK
jgi:hypothetical protein